MPLAPWLMACDGALKLGESFYVGAIPSRDRGWTLERMENASKRKLARDLPDSIHKCTTLPYYSVCGRLSKQTRHGAKTFSTCRCSCTNSHSPWTHVSFYKARRRAQILMGLSRLSGASPVVTSRLALDLSSRSSPWLLRSANDMRDPP